MPSWLKQWYSLHSGHSEKKLNDWLVGAWWLSSPFKKERSSCIPITLQPCDWDIKL